MPLTNRVSRSGPSRPRRSLVRLGEQNPVEHGAHPRSKKANITRYLRLGKRSWTSILQRPPDCVSNSFQKQEVSLSPAAVPTGALGALRRSAAFPLFSLHVYPGEETGKQRVIHHHCAVEAHKVKKGIAVALRAEHVLAHHAPARNYGQDADQEPA